MLEIEIKYALPHLESVRELLIQLGAECVGTQLEDDTYLKPPDRDFAQTDEALRLRLIGDQLMVTYKGPRRSGITKSRQEIELPLLTTLSEALEFFQALRYQVVATIHKEREIFQLNRDGFTIHACLDCVRGLGDFIELEVLASEEQETRIQPLLNQLSQQLHLSRMEPRSYLEMLLLLNPAGESRFVNGSAA
ncbi:MAG: class IV adenylate cyclase [Zavarzinella sp.]